MQKDDKELVQRFINGDKESFELLVNRYLKSVYNFVFRIVRDQSAAEDIIQETFVKIWKNITHPNPSLTTRDGPPQIKPWIFKIARNTAIDYLRKRKNIYFSDKEFEETITDIEPLPDEIFAKKELAKELENALSKIRPDFLEIILLHYTEGLTFDEISEIVGKPLNTVKSHHLRALSAIRKLIII